MMFRGQKTLISILTPVFNYSSYIEQTIRSVLDQTYQNWEWIILDDGSTDGTGDIIRSFKESRIKYAYQEHTGVTQLTKTYNKALRMCNGDYVAMLDHDDYWPEYKLDVQVKGFDDPGIILSYGECCLVNHKGKKIGYMGIPDDASIACNNPIGSSLKVLILERHCFILNSTAMIKKSALLNIGGFLEVKGLTHDYPAWIRLSTEGRFADVSLCLGYWRRHPASVNFNSDPESSFDAGINFLREFILQNGKKLNDLGFFYDMDSIEKHWDEIKKEYITYLPYNRAMLMLRFGLFKEARSEMRKFLERYPSFKNRVIYSLLVFSGLIKMDANNPMSNLMGKIRSFSERTR